MPEIRPGTTPGRPDTYAVGLRAAGVLWRGFDVPDLSRWYTTQVQDNQTGRTISHNPQVAQQVMLVRPIDPGSNPFAEPYRFDLAVRPCNGVSRTELVHYPVNGTPGGAKYFYRWSTLFPLGESEFNSAFPIGPGTQGIWQVFTQWHQASNTGSPPIAFSAKREKSSNAPYIGLELSMPGTPYPIGVWKAPFTYNEWHNFVVSVVYSNSSSQGEVGLWYSTGWAIPPQAVQTWNLKTTASTNPNDKTTGPYLKHGLYRSQKYYGQRHSYVAHCGMVEGDSLAAVLANP